MGKGSKSRVSDLKVYNQNFDEINWSNKPKHEPEKDSAQNHKCSTCGGEVLDEYNMCVECGKKV